MKKQKFYQKKWFAWLTLFIFPPLGIILLWTNKHHGFITRTILSVVFGLIAVFAYTGNNEEKVANNFQEGFEKGLNGEETSEPKTAEEPVEEPKEEPVKEEPVEEPKEEPVKEEPKTFVNVINTLNEAEVKEKISENAKKDWKDDYMMQEYVIEEQTAAYNQLRAINIDSKAKQDILINAFDDWDYDFTMVKYVYEEQLKSYNKVN